MNRYTNVTPPAAESFFFFQADERGVLTARLSFYLIVYGIAGELLARIQMFLRIERVTQCCLCPLPFQSSCFCGGPQENSTGLSCWAAIKSSAPFYGQFGGSHWWEKKNVLLFLILYYPQRQNHNEKFHCFASKQSLYSRQFFHSIYICTALYHPRAYLNPWHSVHSFNITCSWYRPKQGLTQHRWCWKRPSRVFWGEFVMDVRRC